MNDPVPLNHGNNLVDEETIVDDPAPLNDVNNSVIEEQIEPSPLDGFIDFQRDDESQDHPDFLGFENDAENEEILDDPGPPVNISERSVSQEKPVSHECVRVTDVQKDNPKMITGVYDYKLTCSTVGIEDCSPFQCFEKLFPGTIYEHVAAETNKYAKSRLDKMQPLSPRSMFHRWIDVTAADIRAYIALEIAMGIL